MNILEIGSASAQTSQTIHRPSVPEFTARLTATSLEVTINNQQLTGSENINVNQTKLYYGFRFKDPNSTLGGWEYVPIFFVGTSSYGTYYEASALNQTVVSFSVYNYPFDAVNHRTGISRNGPVDIQVMALIGVEIPTTEQNGSVYRFEGETSDWSNTQTVSTPSDSPSVSNAPVPDPTPSPTVPELSWLMILPLFLGLFTVSIIVGHRKTANLKQ
ncbi:hypothetical protein GX563_08630 [Candidatus Bathyarchaeota archaeon]|nr:hypothetical protein [Candidatus Bathyarchaeota archaeon]